MVAKLLTTCRGQRGEASRTGTGAVSASVENPDRRLNITLDDQGYFRVGMIPKAAEDHASSVLVGNLTEGTIGQQPHWEWDHGEDMPSLGRSLYYVSGRYGHTFVDLYRWDSGSGVAEQGIFAGTKKDAGTVGRALTSAYRQGYSDAVADLRGKMSDIPPWSDLWVPIGERMTRTQ